MQLNVEVKARCHDPIASRAALLALGAHLVGVDNQIDTYFTCSRGRLKLREGTLENCLISYTREDGLQPKQSRIILAETEPGTDLKAVLTQALGVLVIVDKVRELYRLSNVRLHIDEVRGLGHFIEIEVVTKDEEGGMEGLHEQCESLMSVLRIKTEDLLAASYSDMILAQRPVDSL